MESHISYLICATNRSGSFLLCEALKNTGIAGMPEEFFWRNDEPAWKERWKISSYEDYVANAIRQGSTPNGVFGAKVMWGYLDDFVQKLRGIPKYQDIDLPDLLPQVFPNLHYIFITRRDKLRQAISFWKAIETGVWALSTDSQPAPAKEPLFNYEAIRYLRGEIIAHEAAWKGYFELCGVEPFEVVYEYLVPAYEDTAKSVLRFLGVPVPSDLAFGKRKMKKQADAVTEEWVEAFLEIEKPA